MAYKGRPLIEVLFEDEDRMREHFGTEPPGPGWTSTGEMRWVKDDTANGGTPRIAIVGGGPGGLFTAYILNQKLPGAHLTIFEASRRLGGKIRTDRFGDGTPFEAGVAELYEYHRPDGEPDPLRLLIEEDLGLRTADMNGGGVILGEDVLRDLDDLEEVFGTDTREAVERFHERMTELTSREKYTTRWQPDNNHPWAKKTFHDCIEEEVGDPDARAYVRCAVHSDLATEPWTCNGLNGIKNVLMDNPEYLTLYHVVGGIGLIVSELKTRIEADVRLGCRVTAIARVGEKYRVTHRSHGAETFGDFDLVVVALPNHFLPQIRWEGDKLQQVVHDLCAHYDLPAHYLRVTVLFRAAWWKRLGLPGHYWTMDCHGGCCVYDESERWKSKKGHVLSFLLAGNAALALASANQDDREIVKHVMDELPSCMAADAKREFVEAQVERYLGSINAQPGGWPAEELRGEHQPEPTEHPGLFVCGDFLFDSTLNAALVSASTAVDLILEHLGEEEAGTTDALELLEPQGETL